MSGLVTNGEATGLDQGLERAALAMLRTLGAGKASLLVPQPVTANEQTGLGLTVPLVNEVEMEPVLLQAKPNGQTLFARKLPPSKPWKPRCCGRAEPSTAS